MSTYNPYLSSYPLVSPTGLRAPLAYPHHSVNAPLNNLLAS